MMGDLAVNNAECRVSLVDPSVELTDIGYRLLYELSVRAGRVVTCAQMLQRGGGQVTRAAPVRPVVRNIWRKLGGDANNPTYIFNEPTGWRRARRQS